jgi:hypothetical protein
MAEAHQALGAARYDLAVVGVYFDDSRNAALRAAVERLLRS